MSLEDLEKRIGRLEDIDRIKKLHVHYVNCLTIASWPEVFDCFAETAVVDFPQGVARGKAEIKEIFRNVVAAMHVGLEGNFVVHPIVEVNGDKATGSWLIYIQFAHPRELPDDFSALFGDEWPDWMSGFYEMEYIRENGEWKISLLKWRKRLISPVPLSER